MSALAAAILLLLLAVSALLYRWYDITTTPYTAGRVPTAADANTDANIENFAPLRLDQIAALVTSTAAKNGLFLRSRVIPAARTWMRNMSSFDRVYVVIEDTFPTRFLLRHCVRREGRRNTYFACPGGEPVYVLSRRCTEEYYAAASACCKVEMKGHHHMLPWHPSQSTTSTHSPIDPSTHPLKPCHPPTFPPTATVPLIHPSTQPPTHLSTHPNHATHRRQVEEGLSFLLSSQPQVLLDLQYLLVGDDDTFWRVDQVCTLL